MKKKNILILGISGQDGTYLAHYLLQKKNIELLVFQENKKN